MKSKNLARLIKFLLLCLCAGSMGWFGFNLATKNSQTQQLKQANKLLAQEQYAPAIAAYDQLLPTELEQKHLVWLNRGYAFSGLGKYQEMLDSCSQVTVIEPQAAWGWNCQGEALYQLQRYQPATKALQRAIAIEPQEVVFWLNQGQVQMQLQSYSQAIAASDRVVELIAKPKNAREQRNLAFALQQKGEGLLKLKQYQPALRAFEASEASYSSYLAQRGIGIAQYELNQYSQAVKTFEQILSRNDLSSESKAIIWLYQSFSQCHLNQDAVAQQAFKQVLALTTDTSVQALAQPGCGIR